MIRKTKPREEFIVDLDGPQGNAFNLMGLVNAITLKYGIPFVDTGDGNKTPDDIIEEMKSGDYKNLVKTFDKYFGSIVVLETTNKELRDA